MDAFRLEPEARSPAASEAGTPDSRAPDSGGPRASKRSSRRPTATWVFLALAASLAIGACSSGSKQQALPPQTLAPDAPETDELVSNSPQDLGVEEISNSPAAPTVEPVATDEAGDEQDDSITMVIESPTGEGEAQEPSLFDAAQAERERREQTERSTLVLDNETLKQYSKGSLTEMESPAEQAVVEPEDTVGDEAAEVATATDSNTSEEADEAVAAEDEATRLWRQEQYWRNRVLDIRQAWRLSLDRIIELEEEVAGLRRAFYAEDDPFYRDSQIKPAWDRALDELDDEKHAAERHQRELNEAMEEGRREGALPGWLREGIELEPSEEEVAETVKRDGRYHEPTEPEVADDGPR